MGPEIYLPRLVHIYFAAVIRALFFPQMVGTMVLIRLAKVAMIASLAAYAFIVAYDNIVDYQSNYEFVRHVLSMDTTFHGNALMHRAISNESIWSLAYALIIAIEGSTALLLVVGALVLLNRLRAPAEVFNRSKVWAVAGCTVGFGLWFLISEAYGHRNVLAAASRLSRTFATLVETLRRLRSGGSQVIRIERVDVRDGGQAVIGNVKSDKLYG